MLSSKQPHQGFRKSATMFPLIREWEESGLSQKEFCVQHDLKLHIFWYWLRRYRERGQSAKEEVSSFVPVKMESAAGESVLAEIIYSDGTRVIFKERVGLKLLQSLLLKPV